MRDVNPEFLCKTSLFQGVTPQEVTTMLGCLAAQPKTYEKGELVWMEGNPVTSVGIVLEGAVRVEGADVWGNASVMGSFSAGEMFGEAFAALPGEPLLTNVVATKTPKGLCLPCKGGREPPGIRCTQERTPHAKDSRRRTKVH